MRNSHLIFVPRSPKAFDQMEAETGRRGEDASHTWQRRFVKSQR